MVLLFGVLSLVGMGLASRLEKDVKVRPNSVLELTFEDPVPEKTNNLEDTPFELSDKKFIGLYDYVQMIRHAAEDDNIKGIVIQPAMASLPMAEVTVIREALKEFKASGKFIYSYSKFYSQNAYYLAATADSVFLNPVGMMEFRGMASNVTFFKKMLDKLDIDVDVFYAGQYKSATEPFRFTEMSESNRRQLRVFLEDMFGVMLEDLARDRGMSTQQVRAIADDWSAFDPEQAYSTGLVDGLIYKDGLDQRIRERTGLEEKDKIRQISASDYYKVAVSKADFSSKDRIALVFMEGEIRVGDEEGGIITDDYYVKILEKIERNDKIKAVVLRVNSPGGSVLAAENIWRAIRNIQAKGKPVVVSMGRYAASGGYYISCFADSIFAQPSTLTGSIGVFSLIPNLGDFMDNKLGITFDTVKTTAASTYFTGVYDLSDQERDLMQTLTDDIYDDFLSKVAEGRQMPKEAVAEIAQGRIWTGGRAVDNGLVDRLGYTEDALASAATLANLEQYRIDEYPKVKDPLQRFLEEITGQQMAAPAIREELGSLYPYYQQIKRIRTMEGVQARLPFVVAE